MLFGRGGLTNRHIGNLRYRDVISLHRDDYVKSSKTEKPNVALRIVQAIKSGPSPGRFLKRGENGKWFEVSDKEASWKASQALREKTRWSCMKENSSFSIERVAKSKATDNKNVAGLPNILKKRKVEEEIKPETQKKADVKFQNSAPQLTSTKSPRMIIPAVAKVNDCLVKKVKEELPSEKSIPLQIERSPLPKQAPDIEQNIITPRNEDVLFGRGGRTNHHPGNIRLREVVRQYQEAYRLAKKIDKPKISKLIVAALRTANPPSRFLRLNEQLNEWVDVGDRRAAEKVSQTLREKERGNRGGSEGSGRTSEPGCDSPTPLTTSPPSQASQDVASPSHGSITETKSHHSSSSPSSLPLHRSPAWPKPSTALVGSVSFTKQSLAHSSPESLQAMATPACILEQHGDSSVKLLISEANVNSKAIQDPDHALPQSQTATQNGRASSPKDDADQASLGPGTADLAPLSPTKKNDAISLPQYMTAISPGKLNVKQASTKDPSTKQGAESALPQPIRATSVPIGDEDVPPNPTSTAITSSAAASPTKPGKPSIDVIPNIMACPESPQLESLNTEIKPSSTPSHDSRILL